MNENIQQSSLFHERLCGEFLQKNQQERKRENQLKLEKLSRQEENKWYMRYAKVSQANFFSIKRIFTELHLEKTLSDVNLALKKFFSLS